MAKVLVVEDVEETREALEDVLERLGFDVDTAEDGAEAELFATLHEYDLVITDLMMPNKNGYELIRMLKKIDCKAKTLAISGGGCLVTSDHAMTLARPLADATLKKPFSTQQLATAVKDVMAQEALPDIGTV